jgi:ParB family chromosome partitioning protein
LTPVSRYEVLAGTTAPGQELAGAYLLPLERIEANPWQPRQHADADRMTELVADIRQRGILQPLVVRPIGDGRYQVVAGERRYRAASTLNLETVPCIIKEDLTDDEARAISLVENLQREDLDIEDEARFLKALHDQGMSLRDIGEAIHKSYQYVNRRLKLLADPTALRAYREGQINLNDLIAGQATPPADVSLAEVGGVVSAVEQASEDDSVGVVTAGNNGSADLSATPERARAGTFIRRPAAFKPFQKLEVYVGQIKPTEIPVEDRDPLRLTITNLIEKLTQLQAQLQQTTEGEQAVTE